MSYSEALEQQFAILRKLEAELAQYRGIITRSGWHPDHSTDYLSREVIPSLKTATPFYWSREMCDVLGITAASVPDAVNDPKLLPAPVGFCWFSKPVAEAIIDTDHFAHQGELVAASWRYVFYSNTGHHGVNVTFYCRYPNSYGVYPAFSGEWDEGVTWRAAVDQMPEKSIGSMTVFMRVFVAALLLMSQRILVHRGQVAERTTRRRLERSGWTQPPLVRVVELRRKERIGDKQAVASIDREWSCQWVVRGHWRQQPCGPSRSQRQPRWITPYIKGPDDKPLKPPRATVFAVVR